MNRAVFPAMLVLGLGLSAQPCARQEANKAARQTADDRTELNQLIDRTLVDCRRIPEEVQRGRVLTELVKALTNVGRYGEALKLSQERQYLYWDGLLHLARHQANRGEFKEAGRVVEMLEARHWKIACLWDIAKAYGRQKRTEEAKAILHQAQAILQKSHALMLEELRQSRDFVDLAGLYAEMGDRKRAAEAFSMAVALKKAELRSCFSDFPSIPEQQALAGFFEEALKSAEELQLMPGFVSIQIAMKGNHDLAKQAALKCPVPHSIYPLCVIAEQQAKSGKRQEALDTLAEVVDRLGKLEDATVRNMDRRYVAQAYAVSGEVEKALAIIGQMESPRAWDKSNAIRSVAEVIVASAPGKSRELLKEAKKSAVAIEESYTRVDALREIALIENTLGDKAGARQTLSLAGEIALEDVKGAKGNPKMLVVLAWSQAEVGDVDASKKTFTLAVELVDNLADNHEIVRDISEYMTRSGLFDMAVDVAKKIPLPSPRQFQYGVVAKGHARSKGVRPVLAWVSRLEDPQERAFALAGLTEGLLAREIKQAN